MKDLLRVELTRLRWRRAVVVLVAACLLVPAAIWVGTAWSTRPFSDDDVAAAEQQAARDADQPWVRREIRKCEKSPENYAPPSEDVDCTELLTPTVANYLYRPTLDVSSVLRDQGVAVVTILAVLVLILGTTFVGHDWNTGSISNQLLFEPRRRRVWLSKALAVVLTGLVVGAVALLAFWGATAALAAHRDIAVPAAQWADVRATTARGIVLVALAGLLGYALTMLFRSTVATLGVGLGIAAGGSLGILALVGEGGLRWLLPSNALAVLEDGFDYYVWNPACDSGYQTGAASCMRTITLVDGSLYLGVVLAVVVAASLWSFQRRDLP
ncbi:hypothetical protein ASG76_04200 [Nocardioides sp. Soil774]|uniref:ABC transporter permease subunit n=1 Tax=Nocardioides sp. Soil774 TaxID=1736408 RepID=UPI0006F476C9|nr:ABC transporter permease subunit [Nocardioides sp. Soil774]KRE96243.1 hypothetical protein ASG76_04200 [Nocardioides sp. Soil774]